jgi:metallo-beta-lactamase family protein
VTGSKTLVRLDSGGAFLVDCGLFQGPRALREQNWQPLDLGGRLPTSVVLTHAHLDHCGYLPALVRQGFSGPIHCTANTAELTAIVLRDSARLQEEDAAFAARKGFSRHADPRPLYDVADAERAIAALRPVPYGTDVAVAPGAVARLHPAGHILGSATVHVREESTGRTLMFSGDLGRGSHPLLRPPAPPAAADTLVVESTYGNRVHGDVDDEIQEMADVISRTLRRGGTVVIPAFAVDRTEILLRSLRTLQDQQRIPVAPISVDSPMALAALGVYRRAIADADPEVNSATIAEGTSAIDLPNAQEATTREESMALDAGGARIIVSASGMASGGRVTHHLKALLPDPANAVLLVGFQAAGTPGRMLLDGARELRIHGRTVPVRAEVAEIEAFSVHADAGELVDWIRSAECVPERVALNHGEPASTAALAERISRELGLTVVLPHLGEEVLV